MKDSHMEKKLSLVSTISIGQTQKTVYCVCYESGLWNILELKSPPALLLTSKFK